MRKFILLILFINFNIVAYNQVIKGTILDKQTHNKISSALVYFSGTFVRTNTDKNGKFELDISKFITMPLTISASGYYSVTLTIVSPEKPALIYLKPKENKLKQVVSNSIADDKERKKNLSLFKNTFLGTTSNARNCQIINENDIEFVSCSDTLKAFSMKPILVDNKALGYSLTYYLDKFELYNKNITFSFSGNIFFSEALVEENKKEFYEVKRRETYDESVMYFFRSLWKNALDSDGFVVKNMEDQLLDYNEIVMQKDSLSKYLICHRDLSDKSQAEAPQCYIIFRKKEMIYDKRGKLDPACFSIPFLINDIYFDKKGYFDSSGIKWEGRMAKQRIADLLPYEYEIK
jgi:hypothetical protein